MAKRGQPTKYRSEYCERLIEFMGRPMPYECFAGEVGVDRDTLYQWEKDQKEFSDAKKRGRAAQFKALFELGLKGMQGHITVEHDSSEVRLDGKGVKEGEKAKPKSMLRRKQTVNGFNTTAWIFMMKNMAGWKDRVEISEDDEVDTMDFDGAEPA